MSIARGAITDAPAGYRVIIAFRRHKVRNLACQCVRYRTVFKPVRIYPSKR